MLSKNKLPSRQQAWRVGVIDDRDYEEQSKLGKARVRLGDKTPGILTKPLPVMFPFTGENKWFAMPQVGDRVVVMTDERTEDGIIMGSIYTKQNQPLPDNSDIFQIKFADDTFIEYDKNNKTITINSAGDIKINSEGKVLINSD